MAEAALEFGVGSAQRGLGVDGEMAREIDDGEQEIADFARGGVGVARRDFRLDLVELLAQFGEDGRAPPPSRTRPCWPFPAT